MADKLSTTALAKRLELPVSDVFEALSAFGWINRAENGKWVLTPKGEFEGGHYYESKQYGRYIVWPEKTVSHKALQALESSKLLYAPKMGEKWQLPGHMVNRLLANLGWLKRGYHGWQLTALGATHGGVQMENQNTGMQYVMWPPAVMEHPALVEALNHCSRPGEQPVADGGDEDDLFSKTEVQPQTSLDGHCFVDPGLTRICDWLYLAGVVHACGQRLPVELPLRADFWLPRDKVYIEFWSALGGADQLKTRMQRADIYRELKLQVIDVHPEDLTVLHEFLPRRLSEQGVHYY